MFIPIVPTDRIFTVPPHHDRDQKTTLLMEMVTTRMAKNALLFVRDFGRRLKQTQRFVAFKKKKDSDRNKVGNTSAFILILDLFFPS